MEIHAGMGMCLDPGPGGFQGGQILFQDLCGSICRGIDQDQYLGVKTTGISTSLARVIVTAAFKKRIQASFEPGFVIYRYGNNYI